MEQFLDKGWFGEEVAKFEESFAKYCQVKYSVGVASGLDGLVLSIDALNLPKGAEIIVAANSYIARFINSMKPVLSPFLLSQIFRHLIFVQRT